MLEDNERHCKLGVRNHQKVEQEFTLELQAHRYLDLREFDEIRKQQEVEPAILLALNPKMVYSANSPSGSGAFPSAGNPHGVALTVSN